jgi:hypothetical protein
MRKVPIYLIEKATGLRDEKGVDLYYVFAARLTREAAEAEYDELLTTGAARIRKIYATK